MNEYWDDDGYETTTMGASWWENLLTTGTQAYAQTQQARAKIAEIKATTQPVSPQPSIVYAAPRDNTKLFLIGGAALLGVLLITTLGRRGRK